ncbi:hypothetical protein MJT46_000241 [Ovis ammon polii x Ovis aries]|nr:hypothetical protein MJT46_000241 [Ovis ammon polii x Ovis aries]
MYVGGHSPHQQFSDISWVSYNLTQFYYVSGDRIKFHRLRTQSHRPTLLPVLLMTSYKSKVPRTHSLGYRLRSQSYKTPTTTSEANYKSRFITCASHHVPSLDLVNLLKWLKKLREAFYVIDYCFIINGYYSGTAK